MRAPSPQQRLIPDLDRVYIASPHGVFTNMTRRSMDGYSYSENGLIKNTGLKLLHRYAKNYKINKRMYSLIIITFDESEDNVEKFLDKTASKLSKDKVRHDAKWSQPIRSEYWYGK